jgi:hypothetical protein
MGGKTNVIEISRWLSLNGMIGHHGRTSHAFEDLRVTANAGGWASVW